MKKIDILGRNSQLVLPIAIISCIFSLFDLTSEVKVIVFPLCGWGIFSLSIIALEKAQSEWDATVYRHRLSLVLISFSVFMFLLACIEHVLLH